jgi:Transposase IS4
VLPAIWHAINTMNVAAMNTKSMAEDVCFDEGGIGSRHRMNPIRQYNKDKPQKFRVDFFLLGCSRTYFIHHIDVYQGANASKVNIHRACRNMPMTQMAVLNAVLSTNMHNKVHGARHIALDNRYQYVRNWLQHFGSDSRYCQVVHVEKIGKAGTATS